MNAAGISSPSSMAYDSETGNLTIVFDDALESEMESLLFQVVDGTECMILNEYRLWCYNESKWFDIRSKAFPVSCPFCGDSEIEDVTEEQFSLRGYPVVAQSGLHGYHENVFDSHGMYRTYRVFVQFNNNPESTPDRIVLTNVFMDGLTDLVVYNITKFGFKYRVTVIGPPNTQGFLSFDWNAVND
jgi:hypothetical protein